MYKHRKLPPVAANFGRVGPGKSSEELLAAALAAKRAQQRAIVEAAPEPDWEGLASKAARTQKAMDAQKSGQRTRTPRANRPAPTPTRYYAQPLSTDPACDERLTGTAVRVLMILRSRLMTGASTMKAALAAAVKVSERTIQRALGCLEDAGYITREAIRTSKGWQIGQKIRLLGAALPPFLREKAKNLGFLGETVPSPFNGNSRTPVSLKERLQRIVCEISKQQPAEVPD